MKTTANPKVSVKDYMEYYACSERTAIRYRELDRKVIERARKRFDGTIRLRDWMLLYSEPPATMCQYVPNSAN
jgi:hypothetical protein